jgi:hypothetical protein
MASLLLAELSEGNITIAQSSISDISKKGNIVGYLVLSM